MKYISEIITVKSKKYNPENSDMNYTCIELESLSQDSGELLLTFDSKKQKSIKNVFNSGDVLFGKLRPYLKKYYLASFDGVCSSEIWVLKSSILNSDYLYAYIQSNSFISLTEISSGSKMPRADWNLISSSLISYSSNFKEKEKIGQIIKLINYRIQTQKKIIENLKLFKNSTAKKIFLQQLRFKDNNEESFPDWDVKKLEEIFYSEKGKGISKNMIVDDGKHECILYGELYTKYNEVVFEVFSKTNSQEGLKSQVGDLLIPSSTTTTGIDLANVTALNKENVLLGGDITVLRSNDKINNVFYAYYLSNHKKDEIASYAQGITIVHLYYNHIKNMNIDFPCFEEQNKIAQFLSSIDYKINLENDLLSQYENQKKYLLANLFI